MSVRPWRDIERRKCRQIMVGNVPVGGDAPIAVQSMTNTLTSDAQATIRQVNEIAEAGADIVRVSCPDVDSTKALKEICKNVPVPIVADIHFHYKRGIEAAEAGAACLRINPGNIGSEDRVREVIKAAKDHGCSMRIGVNGGSLEKDLLEKYGEPCPEAMVESALNRILNLLQIVHALCHQIEPAVGHVFIQRLIGPDRNGHLSHPLNFQFPRVSAQGLPERQALLTGEADKHLKTPLLRFNQVHHAP